MALKTTPAGRKENIVVQELKGEILIYDLKINKAFCLNETSALIWQMCDGNNSIGDISRKLSKKLKAPVTEDFVWLAIDQFQKDNLLDESQEIETRFNGLSRREAIRKVGFASMIALPVISSLIAPTAAMAQSAGSCPTFGQSCATTGSINSQGSCCTNDLRCVSSTCTNCLPSGTSVPGGCNAGNSGNIRRCCSFTCSTGNNRCT